MVRYANPEDCNAAKTAQGDKNFGKRLDLKDTKFPVKIRGIHNHEKKNSLSIIVLGYGNKEKHPICVSKKCCEALCSYQKFQNIHVWSYITS